MARGRMLNQSISEDFEFNAMSCEAKMLYMMAVPHLDRDGLISGHPAIFQGKVCPLVYDILPRIPSIFNEWISADLVMLYESKRGPVLFFTGFAKNNSGMHYSREGASAFAPPPGYHRTEKGLERDAELVRTNSNDDDGSTPDELRTDSGLTPDVVPLKLKESKRKEIETKTNAAGASGGCDSSLSPEGWQEVMRAYESNIGSFTAISSELVRASTEEHGATVVVDAIAEAVKQNIRKWSYVDGILKRWKANGRNGETPKPVKPPRVAQKITIWNQYTNQMEDKFI